MRNCFNSTLISDLKAGEQATKIRDILFSQKKSFIKEGQLSQLCQLAGRNVELMYQCFVLSNIIKVECDDDIVRNFQQKIIEEEERTELGYLGMLKEVLTNLWSEKHTEPAYTTEDGLVKVSNKELYDKYNECLKKEYGQGVSPSKFKEFMLEFGFTDGLNRTKLKVPLPGEPEPRSRLCNIFTDRVLRKLGIQRENKATEEKPLLRFEDLKSVHWADELFSEHECCVCGYKKKTSWQTEDFKGNKHWICEDCKQEWEQRRELTNE